MNLECIIGVMLGPWMIISCTSQAVSGAKDPMTYCTGSTAGLYSLWKTGPPLDITREQDLQPKMG